MTGENITFMKSGAIFDMDGLLVDTERIYGQCWHIAAEAFHQTWVEGFDKLVAGSNGGEMLRIIHTHFPDVDAQAFMEFCVNRARKIEETNLRVMPGAVELVRWFRSNGVRTAVASSSPHENINHVLGRIGLGGSFDAIVSGTDLPPGHEKPAPDIFLLAAERIGCTPEDCYVFEDSVNGCRAGIAAGCTTIMISDLFQPTEDVKAGCAAVFHSLVEAATEIQTGLL